MIRPAKCNASATIANTLSSPLPDTTSLRKRAVGGDTTNNDIISVIEVPGAGNGWDGPVINYRATVQNRDSGLILLTKAKIPSTMYGGAGGDNLSGGSAKDLIFGGDGVDYLVSAS